MEWPDKSGSMRYRPEPMTVAVEECARHVATSFRQLYALDLVIEEYAYALEIIQPSVAGKIAIRFLKRRSGGVEGRHPQFIQWYKSRSGRMLYTRLRSGEVVRRVKGYSLFAQVRGDVAELLVEAIAVVGHREVLVHAITNFRRQMASMAARDAVYIEGKAARIREWLPVLREKREKVLREWEAQVAAADAGLPRDAVVAQAKRPRVGGSRSRV